MTKSQQNSHQKQYRTMYAQMMPKGPTWRPEGVPQSSENYKT